MYYIIIIYILLTFTLLKNVGKKFINEFFNVETKHNLHLKTILEIGSNTKLLIKKLFTDRIKNHPP